MKITSPIGLNLLVDGTVPKVWNLFFVFCLTFLALYLHSHSPYISITVVLLTLFIIIIF